MLTIAVQEPDALLILQQAQLAFRKVKQRADAGIGLAVVVAKRAFVIPAQLRQAVVDGKGPVVAEGLVHFKLHRLVFTLGVLVGVRFAIAVELAAKRRAAASLALGK